MQALVEAAEILPSEACLQAGDQPFDAGEQFPDLQGFLVVVGETAAHGLDHILLVGLPSEQNGLEGALTFGLLLQSLDQLYSIDARHIQIGQDDGDFRVAMESF